MPESNVYFTEGGTNVPDIPEGGGSVSGGSSSTVIDAMKKTTYDPNGYNTDIFAYVNRHVPITSITPTDENIKIWIDPADNSGSIITPGPPACASRSEGIPSGMPKKKKKGSILRCELIFFVASMLTTAFTACSAAVVRSGYS
jgi:hypothetical protein